MNVIKSRSEYTQMKMNLLDKLNDFVSDYDTFVKSTSPSDWRMTGYSFSDLKKLKDTIQKCKPLKIKDLEDEFIRDELLTDEEKEFYNNSKKYNL